MALFRNLVDAATGRVLRFNNAKKRCMKELFLLAESCMTHSQSSLNERTPEKTAFELVVIGIFSPVRWFGEVQSDGAAFFRPYAYFDNPVHFRHVIGSLQAYFWRSLQARAKATLNHSRDFDARNKAARIRRFFEEEDGMKILIEQFVPKLYGHAIDLGELSFEDVFEPSCNIRLEVHDRLFHRYAEVRGISQLDEEARMAWLWLVNSTREDVFELTDSCYWSFQTFYASQREYALS